MTSEVTHTYICTYVLPYMQLHVLLACAHAQIHLPSSGDKRSTKQANVKVEKCIFSYNYIPPSLLKELSMVKASKLCLVIAGDTSFYRHAHLRE